MRSSPFPDPREHIAHLCEGVSLGALARASDELTSDYRSARGEGARLCAWRREHYLAYLVTRLPATARAIEATLVAVGAARPDFSPLVVADLGAGPGTSVWALAAQFPRARFQLYERDRQFVALGHELLEGIVPGPDHEFVVADLTTLRDIEPADLVLFSYSLGEMTPASARACVDRAWAATRGVLIAIEPGSPRGFRTILGVRDQLTRAGGFIAAPCPHAAPCPLGDSDWCHFPARVSRSQLHRRLKGATLSYEDEKFAYVAMSRVPVRTALARIIRRPQLRPRAVTLVNCTRQGGIEDVTVGRSDRRHYRAARAAAWGDSWPEPPAVSSSAPSMLPTEQAVSPSDRPPSRPDPVDD